MATADTGALSLALKLTRTDAAPLRSTWSYTAVADESIAGLSLAASTTGVTLDLSAFATIDAVVLRNRSNVAAETVRLEYTYEEFTEAFAADELTFTAGAANDSISPAFASSDYRAGASIVISGADNGANNGTFTLEAVSTAGGQTSLLFAIGAGFAAAAPDTLGPTLKQRHNNAVALPAGGKHIGNDVLPSANLLLTSASGTPRIDVWVLGS